MFKILKHCPICDKEFKNSNRKYCSDECSAESIRERDRIRKRKKREADQQARLEKAIKRREERKANSNILEVREHRHVTLKAKADKGDYMAIMALAKPFSYEYWEAYQQHEIQQAKQYKNEPVRLVNGISVYDDLFAEKVLITIEELGRVATDLVISDSGHAL